MKNIIRLRIQNNQVKRKLIKQIPQKSIVIDIGSGFGGDIMKYNGHVSIVLLVEPDEINRNELYKRLDNLKSELVTKFIVLDCGGEDYETITRAYLDIKETEEYMNLTTSVVSMLSLTFFWNSEKLLRKFEKTLTEIAKNSIDNCYFYFFTIEGNRFRKMLDNHNDYINNSAIKAKYIENNTGISIKGQVKIKITDSIVRTQYENLVDLKDLKVIKNLEIHDGLIETYLSEIEKEYGETHIYGKALIIK